MTANWIAGLMRQNYEAVGFLPTPAIERQYIANGRYVLQTDERGRNVGYILYGSPRPGAVLDITQHCIDLDYRLKGYGEAAFVTVLARAQQRNCQAIVLRCAVTLPSNHFWREMGFTLTNVKHPDNRRQRAINVYTLDLWRRLL